MARSVDRPSAWLLSARDQWHWRGQGRPPFAVEPGPDRFSVWDYSRPPVLAPDTRQVAIRWGDVEVARTRRAIRALETSHPPSFYVPWDDVVRRFFQPSEGTSFCEWKGPARFWTMVEGERRLPRVAWSYPQPLAGAEVLANCVAFYPSDLDCTVEGEIVRPQPGGFYGGWITPELTGPFKGESGSEGW